MPNAFASALLLAAAALNRAAGQPPTARVRLTPCTVGLGRGASAGECGVLTVFENLATRQGRTIDIHYVVLRAQRRRASDALVMFAGGPGQSSLQAMSAVGWSRPVLATMDILLVEQRGTGQSHPLACETRVASDPAAAFGHVFDPAMVRRCRASLEADADLTQYTTTAAARDVEAVRALLGYDKLSLYGASYGTRLAQEYMRLYPSRVKAVVIDGTVPFDNALPVTYAASAQQSLDRVFAACVNDTACHASHPALAEEFRALLHRFDAGAVGTTVTSSSGVPVQVKMSRGDFAYAVRGILYSVNAPVTLPDLIGRAASTGDVHEFAQVYWARAFNFTHDFPTGCISRSCARKTFRS